MWERALTNGNYVVDSAHWNNYMGAVTWGSGTTGVVGVVSAANSLVGTTRVQAILPANTILAIAWALAA